jgi:hypothetical protein
MWGGGDDIQKNMSLDDLTKIKGRRKNKEGRRNKEGGRRMRKKERRRKKIK